MPTVVALIAWSAVLAQLDPAGSYPQRPEGPGLTVDEMFNAEQGVYLVEALRAYQFDLLSPQGAREVFGSAPYLPDHPPLGRLWLGICHHVSWWWSPPQGPHGLVVTACARTGSAMAFALTVWLVGVAASCWWGRVGGMVAAVSLLLMPRPFGHAHLASLETVTNFSCLLALLATLAVIERPALRKREALLAGVALGMALLTKVQAILWCPLLGLLWLSVVRKPGGLLSLLLWGLAAVGVFFVAWPWLWLDPVGHPREYLGRTTDRAVLQLWYLGQQFSDRGAPWHYPAVIALVTVPLGTWLLGLGNIWPGAWWSLRPSWRREGGLLAAVLLPIAIFSLPGVPVYDEERLFLIICPPLALLAGRGAQALTLWWGRPVIFITVALATLQIGVLIGQSPCWLGSYSVAIGGPSGAASLGLTPTYWGDSQTRELLAAMVKQLPMGTDVSVAPVLHPFQLDDLKQQSPILQRHQTHLHAWSTAGPTRYILIFWRRANLPAGWSAESPPGKPLYEITRFGVVLGGLYELAGSE